MFRTEPRAEDVVIEYELGDEETLQLVSGGRVLWSSASLASQTGYVDVEINVEPETAIRFYRDVLATPRASYWLPPSLFPPPYLAYRKE